MHHLAEAVVVGLTEIASGLEVTAKQRERSVAVIDGTEASLPERLRPFAGELPCSPAAAATVVEVYARGASIGAAAGAAGLAPIEGAKTLHLLGESVTPFGPTGRRVVRDWLSADLSRSEAIALTGASPAEFALASYVETHEPIAEAVTAVAGVLEMDGNAAVAKRDALDETMSDVTDLL